MVWANSEIPILRYTISSLLLLVFTLHHELHPDCHKTISKFVGKTNTAHYIVLVGFKKMLLPYNCLPYSCLCFIGWNIKLNEERIDLFKGGINYLLFSGVTMSFWLLGSSGRATVFLLVAKGWQRLFQGHRLLSFFPGQLHNLQNKHISVFIYWTKS